MWYDISGESGDIAVSSRIRLARNIVDYPFPGHMNSDQENRLLSRVSLFLTESAGGNEFHFINLHELELPFEAGAMVERHLISPELAAKNSQCGVVLSADESISVMINEEDHMRIQALGSGLCLKECMDKALRLDDLLESEYKFAWTEQLGYLTHCPTNLGTAMRASVMLHLSSHTGSGEIKLLVQNLSKLGFAVRGLYGEGSMAFGSLYQISNQLTLGINEEESIERLLQVTERTIERERELRNALDKRIPGFLEDRAWRAYGLLTNARSFTSGEAMNLLSNLRTGVARGIIPGIPFSVLNSLNQRIQSNSISVEAGRNIGALERHRRRAEIIRDTLRAF